MSKEIIQDYKSIKVPKWVHENSKQASLIITRKGIENLPKEVLVPEYCPFCKTKMEKLQLKHFYRRCPHCGYKQQDFTSSNFLKGAPIGGSIALGLSLLIYFISKD